MSADFLVTGSNNSDVPLATGWVTAQTDYAAAASTFTALSEVIARGVTKAQNIIKADTSHAGRFGMATEATLSAMADDIATMGVDPARVSNNQSTTPLSGGDNFTGVSEQLTDNPGILVNSFSDVAGANNGIEIQWSNDNFASGHIDWIDYLTPVANNGGYAVAEFIPKKAEYCRPKYTNGGSAQSIFRFGFRRIARGETWPSTAKPYNVIVQQAPAITNIPTGAANLHADQVTPNGTSSEIIAARATRRKVIIKNIDSANSVYLKDSTVTSSDGYLLKKDETVEFETTSAIHGISSSSSTVLAYVELYD